MMTLRLSLVVTTLIALIAPGVVFASSPPAVISVSPPSQIINAERNTHVVVTFDTTMDPATITSASIMVFGHWSGVRAGVFQMEENNTRVRFIPALPFFAGEWVTVSLSRAIRSQSGQPLAAGYTWNFWTRCSPGTLNLTEIARLPIRLPGEPQIQAYGAYAGDLNRDGWTDFAVPNERSRDIRVFLNDGQGMYSTFSIYPIPTGAFPSTNEGADFNADGIIDLAVGNSQGDSVSVFIGDGNGGFLPVRNYKAASGIRGLSVMDLDGDGDMDIATANRAGNNVTLLHNNGNGTFSGPVILEANGNQETACAAADANGDGILDLFVGAYFSNEMILLLGDGTGGLVYATKVTTGSRPWMIAVGDVDGDGNVDVVSANSAGNNVSVIRGNGQGGLSTAVNYPVSAFPLAIDLGDIDGDGDLDLVTSNFSGRNWTIYENNGSGVFINPRTRPAVIAGSCATLHDRDNDGDLDMTGIDEIVDTLFIFDNRPPTSVDPASEVPHTFALHQNYPNPFNPTTSFEFKVPSFELVTLKVFDLLGREVATLVNDDLKPGNYEVAWDATGVASGVYIYRLHAGEFVASKKLLLVR